MNEEPAPIDIRKIRIMTSLAIYEKENGSTDKETDEYYRKDYIYKKNCSMRIGIVFGYTIILAFYFIYLVFIGEGDFLLMDFTALAIKIIAILVALIVAYTIMGTFVYGRQYDLAQKRFEGYHALVERLESLNKED